MNFLAFLDIPIDQELPDDEDGRRNKDIVKMTWTEINIYWF